LRFGFRQIERSAIRLCHGGYKKTEKAENLRKNVPAEQSEVRMPALRRDDVSEIEAVGHEQHADDGKRERELVTHHLRRTAQPSEQRILAIRGPAGERDAIDTQRSDGVQDEKPDVQIGNAKVCLVSEN